MYQCKIVADSISDSGCRLTTFEVTFPRLILSEWNTHRVFSRNTASSRAIPVKRLLKAIKDSPFIPEKFPKNQAGMSNNEWLGGWKEALAKFCWFRARDLSLILAFFMTKLGVHKQISNRLLEPFMWTTSVTSSTEWENFFNLRCSPLAQPEIQKIAYLMRDAYKLSTPRLMKEGEWHLPYVTEEEREKYPKDAPLLSAGRSGKVSYLTHGESNTPEKDISIARDKMAGNNHWSPLEHPSVCTGSLAFIGNFRGWKQLRKFYPNESGENL